MNLPLVETILFKYMRSPTFMELPSHPDMDFIPCSKRLIVASLMFFSMDSSHLVKSDLEKRCIGIINDVQFITHIHAVKCAFELQNRWSHSQLVGASFQHSFKCNYAITSFKSHSHVRDDKPRWRYEDIFWVQRCSSIAAGIVFEQHCPQYDLNVLVHWLSFFEHHCPQLTDSSFNHLPLPHSWSEYCLFSFLGSTVLPPDGQLFKECQEELMSFLSGILQIRSMFFLFDNFVLESTLILQRSCLFKV